MAERTLSFESINPVDLYGINDNKLEQIRQHFPKLKIIARGNTIKVVGDEQEIGQLEQKLDMMIDHFHKFGKLSEQNIDRLMGSEGEKELQSKDTPIDVIVFGNAGLQVKAQTPNQKRMVESYYKNDMVFAIGPAGTGKTYTAVALAVRALKNKEVKRIILTRPAVEAGETLGFLPGDMKEKLDPYLKPLYDALFDMVPAEKLNHYLETGVIEIAPLAFMRGRTLDNAFVILDEAQNATESQLKMFLTRMGKSAKFYVTGDMTQIDLPRNQRSGLKQAVKILNNVKGIDIIMLDERDVVRHRIVTEIINAYKKADIENNDNDKREKQRPERD